MKKKILVSFLVLILCFIVVGCDKKEENNSNQNNDLADPNTAFLRGNLFNSLYDPYKNYKYRELKPKNQMKNRR